MKNLFYISVIFVLMTFSLVAQTQTDSLKVAQIKETVNKINADTGLTAKIITDSLNGNRQVVGYFKNEQLVLIRYFSYSGCIPGFEFYLQKDMLLAAFVRVTEPDIYGHLPYSRTYELYFEKRRLIRSDISGGLSGQIQLNQMPCNIKMDDSWAKKYSDECYRYVKILNGK